MGDILNKANDVYRDFKTDGVPASGHNDPEKPDIRDLFKTIDIAVYAAQTGISTVANLAARDAFYTDPDNQSKLVYVNDNNGAADDPDNGIYEYVDGAPRIATGYVKSLAAPIQPLVDDAAGSATAAAASAASIAAATDQINISTNILDGYVSDPTEYGSAAGSGSTTQTQIVYGGPPIAHGGLLTSFKFTGTVAGTAYFMVGPRDSTIGWDWKEVWPVTVTVGENDVILDTPLSVEADWEFCVWAPSSGAGQVSAGKNGYHYANADATVPVVGGGTPATGGLVATTSGPSVAFTMKTYATVKNDVAGLQSQISSIPDSKQAVERLGTRLAAVRAGQPTPYTLHPTTEAYRAACLNAGLTCTEGRLNRHSRMMDRLDAVGVDYSNLAGAYTFVETEAASLVNIWNPGTYDMTVLGEPVFVANYAANSGSSMANGYEIDITLGEIDPANFSMGMLIDSNSNTSGPEMGAIDGSAGVILWGGSSSGSSGISRCFSVNNVAASGRYATFRGMMSMSRRDDDEYSLYHFGVKTDVIDEPIVVPSSTTNKLRLVGATGASASAGAVPVMLGFFAKGLSDVQMAEVCAALEDFKRCVQYGDPVIYERGVGPAVINADVIVYGLNLGSICGAYEASRRGLSVALVGDWFDETIWDLTGMPASGLWWTDIRQPGAWGGVGREAVRWARAAIYATADDDNQSAVSIEPRAWVAAACRMLDPSRTDTSANAIDYFLPGQDVKVYMTGGVDKVSKKIGGDGPEIAALHTRDGRTFKARAFVDGTYDCDTLKLANLPCITGLEAASEGAEAFNGFNLTFQKPKRGSVDLDVDPFVTEGDSTSGLLPLLEKVPAVTEGAAWTLGLQAMNYRVTITNNNKRNATWDTIPPPDYDPLRYELVARRMKAAADAGEIFILNPDFVTIQRPSPPYAIAPVFDVNNGGAFTTDMLGSGEAYAAAGLDPVGRRGVFDDVLNYIRGLIYWVLNSGDERISDAVLTGMQTRYLDPRNHLDPGYGRPLYWPRQAYRRDAAFNLVNADFVLTADDLLAADGAEPRSIKTIACASYFLDTHTKIGVIDPADNLAKTQGHLAITPNDEMGSNQMAPIPLEAITPQSSVCANLAVLFGGSWTKIAHSGIRMEATMAQLGESAAAICEYAIKHNVAVRDVDYPTIRTSLVDDSPYSRPLVLPQVA